MIKLLAGGLVSTEDLGLDLFQQEQVQARPPGATHESKRSIRRTGELSAFGSRVSPVGPGGGGGCNASPLFKLGAELDERADFAVPPKLAQRIGEPGGRVDVMAAGQKRVHLFDQGAAVNGCTFHMGQARGKAGARSRAGLLASSGTLLMFSMWSKMLMARPAPCNNGRQAHARGGGVPRIRIPRTG